MAVGSNAYPIVPGYVAMGKETTWGTYASATTGVEAISCSFRTEIESEKLDTIGINRGFSKRVTLNKTVGGELETYLHPVESALLLANALCGQVVSTAGSTGVYNHSISAGNYDTTTCILGLSFNLKKGGQTWRYSGGRVNSMKISAAVGEPVKCSWELIFKDSTIPSDDIGGSLSVSSFLPMTFVNGTFRYAATEAAAATTTVAEPIQGFELTVNNNLVSEEGARELGTNLLTVLPPTRREVELTITQRFDTSSSYNRFIQATIGAAELFFRGPDSLSSDFFTEITFRMPKLYQNSSEPTMDGADSIAQSEITYDVVVDNPNTTTGKDIGITVKNNLSSL
jgi:hypothetical protein